MGALSRLSVQDHYDRPVDPQKELREREDTPQLDRGYMADRSYS